MKKGVIGPKNSIISFSQGDKVRKEVYFYWGQETMSFLRFMSIYSFYKFNPDWNINLIKRNNSITNIDFKWEEKLDFNNPDIEDCSHLLSMIPRLKIKYMETDYPKVNIPELSEVQMKDITWWYILANEGGIVTDIDILFIKPLDNSNFNLMDVGLICFEGLPKKDYIPVTFMCGNPNIFFKQMYQDAVNNVKATEYESAGYEVIHNKFNRLSDIQNYYPSLTIKQISSHTVFPFANTNIHYPSYPLIMFEDNYDIPWDCIGIHWYAGNPISQNWNTKITKDNFREFDNLICNKIKEIVKDESFNI